LNNRDLYDFAKGENNENCSRARDSNGIKVALLQQVASKTRLFWRIRPFIRHLFQHPPSVLVSAYWTMCVCV